MFNQILCTENLPDIANANSANLDQPIKIIRRRAEKAVFFAFYIYNIVGDQTVTPRNQLKSTLGFSRAGFAGDKYAYSKYLDQNSVDNDV